MSKIRKEKKMKKMRSRRATRRARARAARRSRPGTGTVGEYLTRWVEGKQSLRPSTRLSYATHIRRYLIPHLGDIALVELRPHHLEAMYRSLASDPDLRYRVSPATLARVHATLMSALGTAVRRGLIDRNPAETVELPTPGRPELMVWTAEQLAEFLGGIVDDDLYPLFVLLALCGLRRGEAVGLRWRDVDLEHGVLRVRQQIIAVGRHIVVGEPKSRAGHRHVALDITTVRLLHCHRAAQERQQEQHGAEWVETGLVFTEPNGSALDPTYVSRHFDRLVARSGLPRLRLHDLRHSSASIGLASGESLLEVSRRLGHSSIAVTADIYSTVAPEVARESAERLSRAVFHP
jgi:integrase